MIVVELCGGGELDGKRLCRESAEEEIFVPRITAKEHREPADYLARFRRRTWDDQGVWLYDYVLQAKQAEDSC